MKTYKIKNFEVVPYEDIFKEGLYTYGLHTFMWKEDLADIEFDFGRGDLCLRVFRHPYKEEPTETTLQEYNANIGGVLGTATIIQNICAFYNLAPRVYGHVIIEHDDVYRIAQVCERAGPLTDKKDFTHEYKTMAAAAIAKVQSLLRSKRIDCDYQDSYPENVVQGLWVDFHDFSKVDLTSYKEYLVRIAGQYANHVRLGSYQTLGDIVKGERDIDHRIEAMGLDKVDFEGKTVLDIGCSGGAMCNYAYSRGAKRVVGVDLDGAVMVAREVSNYLGNHNVDYYPFDLCHAKTKTFAGPKGLIYSLGTFDIVFNLAMSFHMKHDSAMFAPLVKELMIFEGNNREWDEPTLEMMRREFKRVEYVGETSDLLTRKVHIGYKNE